jgi:hypothetical protein
MLRKSVCALLLVMLGLSFFTALPSSSAAASSPHSYAAYTVVYKVYVWNSKQQFVLGPYNFKTYPYGQYKQAVADANAINGFRTTYAGYNLYYQAWVAYGV